MTRSVKYIKIYTTGALFMAIQWTCIDMTTALGEVRLALFCSLFRKSLFVGGLLLFPIFFTAPAAFAAEPFCDCTGSLVSITLFLRFLPKILAKYSPPAV